MNPMQHIAYFSAGAQTIHEHAAEFAKLELDADQRDILRAEIDKLNVRLMDLRATLPQRSERMNPLECYANVYADGSAVVFQPEDNHSPFVPDPEGEPFRIVKMREVTETITAL